MSTQRKQYSAECKARVALEALKGLKTVNELASTYGVHPTQIAHRKHGFDHRVGHCGVLHMTAMNLYVSGCSPENGRKRRCGGSPEYVSLHCFSQWYDFCPRH